MQSRNLSPAEYLKRAANQHQPKYRFAGKSTGDFNNWKLELLAALKDRLGPMPVPVDLNPEIIAEIQEEGLIKRRVLIDLEEDMSAVGWLYVPVNKPTEKLPAILCCHGHGQFGKDSVMGIRMKECPDRGMEIDRHNYDYGLQMAKSGYVTFAIDWRGFGERSDGDIHCGRDACNVNYILNNLLGRNLLALNVFDGMRAIDYLTSLDCVDADNIGVMGLSFGGTMTTWISMLDERVKAADIICYSARFAKFSLERMNTCGSQLFFDLFNLCDLPDLHGLIAPKPLLAEVGLHDKCFTIEESTYCYEEVRKIYAAAGVPEHYEVDLFGGCHQFAGNKAFDFFDKHLKH